MGGCLQVKRIAVTHPVTDERAILLTDGITMEYTQQQCQFINSLDFMKLGQAINHEQWQAAAMIVRRMDMKAKEIQISDFERNFTGIHQCINRKDMQEAKQIMAAVINKRAKYLNEINAVKGK